MGSVSGCLQPMRCSPLPKRSRRIGQPPTCDQMILCYPAASQLNRPGFAGGRLGEVMRLWRRWCTRQTRGEMAPEPRLLRDDRPATDGVRAPGRQHPVQHRHADGSLGPLGGEAAGSQTRSD